MGRSDERSYVQESVIVHRNKWIPILDPQSLFTLTIRSCVAWFW